MENLVQQKDEEIKKHTLSNEKFRYELENAQVSTTYQSPSLQNGKQPTQSSDFRLAEKIRELETLVQQKDEEVKKYMHANEDLRTELMKAQTSTLHQTQHIQNIPHTTTTLSTGEKSENSTLKEQLETLRFDNQILLKKVATLEKVQTNLNDDIMNKNVELSKLENLIQKQNIEIAQLQQQKAAGLKTANTPTGNKVDSSQILQQAEAEAAKLLQENQQLRDDLEKTKKESRAQIEALERENQMLLARIKSLENTIQEKDVSKETQPSSNEKVNQELERLRNSERFLTEANARLKNEKDDIRQQLDQLFAEKQELVRLKNQIVNLEASMHNYESDLAKAKVIS